MATKPETPAPAPETPAAAAKGGGGSGPSLLPVIIAVVAAPAITWAVCQFVLIPSLRKELGSAGGAEDTAHAAPASEDGHGKKSSGHGKVGEKASPDNGYTFENVVVNLAGTMGTRYLKTTFLVTGPDADLKAVFEGRRAELVDVTLNVLSSLSIADLEEAGSKNLIREKLVQSFNQALGRKVAEQVFFSDFVVQ